MVAYSSWNLMFLTMAVADPLSSYPFCSPYHVNPDQSTIMTLPSSGVKNI